MLTDKKEFNDWFKTLLDKKTKELGQPGYHPKNMDEWIDIVDENHKEIRELLGGFKKTVDITPKDNGKVIEPSLLDCEYEVNNVIRLLPGYLKEYDLEKKDLAAPKLKKFKNISTTKHIMGYAERQKVSSDLNRNLQYYCAQLGSRYSSRIDEDTSEYKITISTEPKAFAKLGNYGIDANSCFNQGSMNSDKKYTYGAHKNTAVILVNNPSDEDKAITRALCTFTDDCKIMCVSNSYPQNVSNILRKLAEKIFDSKELVSLSSPGCIRHAGGINYINDLTRVFARSKNYERLEKQVITFDTRYSKESHPKSDYYANW